MFKSFINAYSLADLKKSKIKLMNTGILTPSASIKKDRKTQKLLQDYLKKQKECKKLDNKIHKLTKDSSKRIFSLEDHRQCFNNNYSYRQLNYQLEDSLVNLQKSFLLLQKHLVANLKKQEPKDLSALRARTLMSEVRRWKESIARLDELKANYKIQDMMQKNLSQKI